MRESRNCLYKADANDNVGVVIIDPEYPRLFLDAGETVPVRTAAGTEIEIITLQTKVPAFFKVSIEEIGDGDEIKKHGSVIGHAVSQVYHSSQVERSAYFQKLTIPKGYPMHITNFIPSETIFDFWKQSFAVPFNLIIEHGETPFEFYSAKHNIAAGKEIFLSDMKVENNNLKEKLLPAEISSAVPKIIIGYAKSNIAKNEKIRFGNIVGHGYRFKGREDNIRAIRKTYRFIKGSIYEHSW